MTRIYWIAGLILLLGAFLAGIKVEGWRGDERLQRLQAEMDRQAAQQAAQAFTKSREAQTQHEATSKRLQTDLAAARAARDAALRGLRALPASDICPAGAAQPGPDPARAGTDGPDRADAGDPRADALREAGRARERAVMYNALLGEYQSGIAACAGRR